MTDQELLIEGCINGDRKCQQKLYETFYGKMMVVCLRYCRDRDEALDVFQEAFIKVFNNLVRYGSKGSFEGWVRRIMVNTAIDHIRKNKKLKEMVELKEEITRAEEEDEAEDLLDKVSFKDLLNCVQDLSPAYRTVFNMYVMDGYSHKEIASELGISEGTSKSNLAKAKMNLKKLLIGKIAGLAVYGNV
jgi:RNA polymerase sigma factor (sigma-70 family)